MPSLPVLNGNEVVKAFQRVGWELARQRGSHIIMVQEGFSASLSVPNHRPVARGTLRSLIRDAGLSVEEFCALL